MMFNATFNNFSVYTMAVSFIGARNRGTPEKTTDLLQVSYKLYHIKL